MPSQITLLVKKRQPTSRLPKPVQDTLRTAKLAARNARKALLNSLGTELDTAAAQNNGRLPYNYMSNLVENVHQNPSMVWVTADVIYGHRRRMKENQMEEHSSPPLEQCRIPMMTKHEETKEDAPKVPLMKMLILLPSRSSELQILLLLSTMPFVRGGTVKESVSQKALLMILLSAVKLILALTVQFSFYTALFVQGFSMEISNL
jgi:hypothetical protein